MFEFNIVEQVETHERAYYVNGTRFDRTTWRACMELEIKLTSEALDFTRVELQQAKMILAACKKAVQNQASFEIPREFREHYRAEMRLYARKVRHLEAELKEGQALIEDLSEKLED